MASHVMWFSNERSGEKCFSIRHKWDSEWIAWEIGRSHMFQAEHWYLQFYFAIIYLYNVQMIVSPNVPDGTFPILPINHLTKSRNSLAAMFRMEH
jgi:hypothetical protein